MNQSVARDGAWGAAARDWAEAQEGTMRPIFEAVLEQTAIGPGSTVLDVACGTGLFCALALARGATAAGLDASAEQLVVARERVPQADFREGEMEALPFADGTFDLITCCNALQYAGDPAEALRKMRRVGRSGATVGILTISREGPHGAGVSFAALEPVRPPPGPNAP
jgi:ubiquinone/menaquinone biosynthesis C-methylase UbiE